MASNIVTDVETLVAFYAAPVTTGLAARIIGSPSVPARVVVRSYLGPAPLAARAAAAVVAARGR